MIFGGVYYTRFGEVGRFMKSYFQAEAIIRPQVRRLLVLDDGDMGLYRMEFLNGQKRQHNKSIQAVSSLGTDGEFDRLFLTSPDDGITGVGL